MANYDVYQQIAQRAGGELQIGVVGPVRTGKSTLIRRFMDLMVLPELEEAPARERVQDELPQSAAGRTIMTTQMPVSYTHLEALLLITGGRRRDFKALCQAGLRLCVPRLGQRGGQDKLGILGKKRVSKVKVIEDHMLLAGKAVIGHRIGKEEGALAAVEDKLAAQGQVLPEQHQMCIRDRYVQQQCSGPNGY